MKRPSFSPIPCAPMGLSRLRAHCNALAAHWGLELSVAQFTALEEHCRQVVWETGRVEFGESVLPRLVAAFCDSPYLSPRDWEPALTELTKLFYHFKNQCGDALDDETLVGAMQAAFNGPAHGSFAYLAVTSLEGLCRLLRTGEEAPDD